MPETTYTQDEVAKILAGIVGKLDTLATKLDFVQKHVGKVNGKEWYTIAEFAQRCGLGVYAVRKRITKGLIIAEQAEGKASRLRIHHSELEKFHGLNESKSNPTPSND